MALPSNAENAAPLWMRRMLQLAGIYNLVWGVAIIFFPLALFRWANMELPRYPQIWQCLGMVIGVYGLGYLIAARSPRRHWPIVLVGLLGKLFGPLGFLVAALQGQLPWAFGVTLLTNDLVWWVPFGMVLYDAYRFHTDPLPDELPEFKAVLRTALSQRGKSLAELSEASPVLVVFIRHGGCVFCRETLADLAAERKQLAAAGVTPAVVHMSSPLDGAALLAEYDLQDVHRFSDPHCQLYKAFGLARGSLTQVLGPRIWWKGFQAWRQGHGFSGVLGDPFQLGGAFLLRHGQIERGQAARTSAERLNFAAFGKGCSNGECSLPESAKEIAPAR